ncbi:hypothetical protein N657DRAFT_572214 [Parathielavia appendiculata]|uniref:non-specific serine/threonine protein kinase n=1 Tax=Parathielavia appendiculata TaxID=2587402 RepID=A0AAN6U1L9_9PEZI|nr:hypothetical protein N657DRAFT_572214 [Parathielavia appendiculata]
MSTTTHARTFSTPYREGVELRIQHHVPPKPFGSGHGPCPRAKVAISQRQMYHDRVDFALDHPPLETEPPSREEHTFTITGTKTLRRPGLDPGGAQVVSGYFDGDKEVVCLAKIYDGVYYPLQDEDGLWLEWDCMTLADVDYAIETWAYGTMQPVEGVGAMLVPEYHGAWTFSLDTDQPGIRRWVRMLLLELVPGETIFDKIPKAKENKAVQYYLLPDEETRLRVLKNTFEAYISIWWDAEVLHRDLAPRNVMVKPDGSIVLIDFDRATVFPFYYRPHQKYKDGAPPVPHSPIEQFWPFSPGWSIVTNRGSWADWFPQSWLMNREFVAEWLLETWGSPPPGKYAPLSKYFLDHPAHAKRSRKLQAALEKLGRKPAKE